MSISVKWRLLLSRDTICSLFLFIWSPISVSVTTPSKVLLSTNADATTTIYAITITSLIRFKLYKWADNNVSGHDFERTSTINTFLALLTYYVFFISPRPCCLSVVRLFFLCVLCSSSITCYTMLLIYYNFFLIQDKNNKINKIK